MAECITRSIAARKDINFRKRREVSGRDSGYMSGYDLPEERARMSSVKFSLRRISTRRLFMNGRTRITLREDGLQRARFHFQLSAERMADIEGIPSKVMCSRENGE